MLNDFNSKFFRITCCRSHLSLIEKKVIFPNQFFIVRQSFTNFFFSAYSLKIDGTRVIVPITLAIRIIDEYRSRDWDARHTNVDFIVNIISLRLT